MQLITDSISIRIVEVNVTQEKKNKKNQKIVQKNWE
jgi:hypothetical protein